MKHIKLLCAGIIAIFVFFPFNVCAAEEVKTEKSAVENGTSELRPFHDTIIAIDKAAKTFTLHEHKRVFIVTADTKITRKDVPATFDDLKVKMHVTGWFVVKGDRSTGIFMRNDEHRFTQSLKFDDETPISKSAKALVKK